MKRAVFVLPLMGGCVFAQADYQENLKRFCHPTFGCEVVPWWTDDDGDGWGSGEPTWSDERPANTVNNGYDCNDADETVPAGLGLCPQAVGEPVDWVMDEGVEYLFVGQAVTSLDAWSRCDEPGWLGQLGAPDPVDREGWVARAGAELGLGWSGVPGFDALDPVEPVAFVDGALTQPPPSTPLPFVCSRPEPDPADWYTRQEAP